MISNDLRYVGDMLAWIHQSCPGEAESIHHLLRQVDKVDKRELETRIMTGATEGVSSYMYNENDTNQWYGPECNRYTSV